MATIQEVIRHIERIAPPALQEGYDNAGLIVGDPQAEVTGVITCLDSIESVVEEARQKGCNLIVAHHPIVFKGLKRMTGRNYVERTVLNAIKHDIAIYAAHTNLDNVAHRGVNEKIANTLGLQDQRILAGKAVQSQLQTTLTADAWEALRPRLQQHNEALPSGQHASWTATPCEGGMLNLRLVAPTPLLGSYTRLVQQASPEALLSVSELTNANPQLGSGMIGRLPEAMEEKAFLRMVKKKMQAGVVRHTRLLGSPVRTVALCGGAGCFLLSQAIRQGADVFITADYKYHEFFDADGRIVIADIGHFESEQYTIELLQEIISEKFTSFAVYCTEVRTNPVHYL